MRPRLTRLVAWGGALVALLGTSVLFALPAEAADSRWQREIEEIGGKLEAERWEDAHKQSTKLLKEVVRRLSGGSEGGRLLAVVLTQRAVASLLLGEEEEALWDFHLAQNFFPEILETDFTRYHPKAQFLVQNALGERELEEKRHPIELSSGRQCETSDPAYRGPEIRSKAMRRYPAAARAAGIDGETTVRFLLDEDGDVSRPLVLTPQRFPTLIWAATDHVRRQGFTPAYCGETPIRGTIQYRIDFKTR